MKGSSMSVVYGIVAIAMGVGAYFAICSSAGWNPYNGWLAAWGLATFAFYGLDKFLAKIEGWRVPKVMLHGLSLVGGFLGGWAGMFLFRHKVRRADFWAVLIISTLIWAGLAYYWFVM